MKKKRSNGPAFVGIAALVALGVWMFGNMGFGIGTTDGDGAGERPDAPAQERAEPNPVAAPPAPAAQSVKEADQKPASDEAPAPVRIAVKGTACTERIGPMITRGF
jgi:hypothetical protein